MMALVPSSAKSPRNEKTSPRVAAIDNHAKLDTPLDFSFMNITDLVELQREDPRCSSDKKAEKNYEDKFNSKCLRLPHNVLQDLKNLPETLPKILVDPNALSWLDLSHNELSTIDPVLCDIPNLRILYLHGNAINNIAEVDKLGGIGTLKKLTLHGNPIENSRNYRFYVLAHIPQLINLDFSAVTKGDRATASTILAFMPQKKKKKQVED